MKGGSYKTALGTVRSGRKWTQRQGEGLGLWVRVQSQRGPGRTPSIWWVAGSGGDNRPMARHRWHLTINRPKWIVLQAMEELELLESAGKE